jgi:DNA polymerase-3 subunit beta
MKFRVDRDALAESVAWAARSLPSRPSVPVLAGLMLDVTSTSESATDQSELRLSGFDYETSARATLPAEVIAEGRALVSGRLLADICRSLPAHQVEITLDGQRVSLVCGSARFTLQTMPVEDYPALPGMPEQAGSVASDAFAHSVAQAVAAAGRDDMLPLLTGVRLEVDGTRISMMATDRFRASMVELEWSPERPDVDRQALVPARVLNDTAKSLTSGEQVGVALADPGAAEGLIGFQGEVGGGTRRTTTESLSVHLTGEPLSIGFNPGYLLDGLAVVDAPWCHLAFTQSTRPVSIAGAPEEGSDPDLSFRYLLMPLRLQG